MVCCSLDADSDDSREFTQRERRRQRERQKKKAIGLDKQNNFARASRFLYISLSPWHDYNVKLPHFTFCQRREQKTTTFFFFSWTLMQSFRIQLEKKFANIWQIKRDGISVIKFEAEQIHFLSDIFVVVAVIVA